MPQEESKWGYWLQASVDDEVIYDRFYAPVRRNASQAPGLPHVIMIRFLEDNPDWPGHKRYIDRPVGLTDAEADAIDAAKKEWTQRHIRAALEAAPHTPTWTLSHSPAPLSRGHIVYDYDRDEPVMVLRETREWLYEDGRSFGLDAEEGYLFGATVRALTPDERAEWDAERARKRKVADAVDRAMRLFAWGQRAVLPADAERVNERPEGERVFLPVGGQCLIRVDDDIYAHLFGAGSIVNAVVRHPGTPERVAVFETLLAASDRGQLHLSALH